MMKSMLLKCVPAVLALGSILAASTARAQIPTNGAYMAFMRNGPAGTTVTTGDGASFMHAGTDWNGTDTTNAGIALPTLLRPATITTYRDATNLVFKFVIPDRTDKQPNGDSLSCGDRVIIQIDAAGARANTLAMTGYYRFELKLNNDTVSSVRKRLPKSAGAGMWTWDTLQTTTASATGSYAGNQYSVTLTIPLAEAGNPVARFGLAMALINDLGHHHGNPAVNEATGTSFPSGVGITPESDPWLPCGQTIGKTMAANGNWVAPVAWGTAYDTTIAGTVTLSQSPSYYFSSSIKLGECQFPQWKQIVALASTNNWEAFQQDTANHWYLYNSKGPCRMTIWINPRVSPTTGVVKKRFLVMWGRPGISNQDWYFAGLTDKVAVSDTGTYVSFIWNNPDTVAFKDHPCLRVYVLPDSLTGAQIATLHGIKTQADLTAMENTYMVVFPSSMGSSQMNFANIDTGSACTNSFCMPLQVSSRERARRWANVPVVRRVLEAGFLPAWLQQRVGGGQEGPGGRPVPPGVEKRVRVVATGFGVAAPTAGNNYVYVEMIGGLGWAVPVTKTDQVLAFNFIVGNPKLTERTPAGGRLIDVPSPPRKILVAYTTTVPSGVKAPTIDTRATDALADTYLAPGQQDSVHVAVTQAGVSGHRPWWLWLLILLILVVGGVVTYVRKHSTP